MTAEIAVTAGHTWLIEVGEQGNDAVVEILDRERAGPGAHGPPGAAHGQPACGVSPRRPAHRGPRCGTGAVERLSPSVRAFDLDAAPGCARMRRRVHGHLQQATRILPTPRKSRAGRQHRRQRARGRSTSRPRIAIWRPSGHSRDPADRALRGETQLAHSGSRGRLAAGLGEERRVGDDGLEDPRHSRRLPARARGRHPRRCPDRDRQRRDRRPPRVGLRRACTAAAGARTRPADIAKRFHMQRGERYDAALQLNNVALTYLYGGNYADCAATELKAEQLVRLRFTRRGGRHRHLRTVPCACGAWGGFPRRWRCWSSVRPH